MKYVNAAAILPEELIAEIQKYVHGKTIYIPKPSEKHEKWGTRSGARKFVDDRNAMMKIAYKQGKTIDELSREYFLATETIKKIVYSK
ncbi:CD3324 family protein [Fictibacillus sp. Mic-4]|uniref:CD3324 family protein n=1 Tax=Fictibacillus TaxID=1329200 RepID=UPI0004116A7B|nr:CD3324 family protein [Fictibacillus gelatini]